MSSRLLFATCGIDKAAENTICTCSTLSHILHVSAFTRVQQHEHIETNWFPVVNITNITHIY